MSRKFEHTPEGLPPLSPVLGTLRDHVFQYSLKTGDFTLKSGRKSEWFLDTKQTMCRPDGVLAVAEAALELLPTDAQAIGGLTMGADPVASALLHQAAAQGRQLDAFVVRKQAKAHGMGRQVEGPSVAGKRVVVLEDTSTTGGSPLTAAEALVAAGAQVVAVATVVDRDTGARQAIEAAGFAYLTAITLEDLGLTK